MGSSAFFSFAAAKHARPTSGETAGAGAAAAGAAASGSTRVVELVVATSPCWRCG